MKIEVRRVTPRLWAVIVDDIKWRRFSSRRDAKEEADTIRRDPGNVGYLEPMKVKAHCNRCGERFTYVAGVLNSTRENEWPKCPTCGSYTETTFDEGA